MQSKPSVALTLPVDFTAFNKRAVNKIRAGANAGMTIHQLLETPMPSIIESTSHLILTIQLEQEAISHLPLITTTDFLSVITLAEKIEFNDIRGPLPIEEFFEYNLTLILLLLESGAY